MRTCLYLLGALSQWVFVSSAAPSVSTAAGTVEGIQCSTTTANAFLAIPFGQPPIGNLRFAAPLSYNSSYSGGTLQATSSAASCIQFGNEFVETDATSEDCLYLDIWSPANTTDASSLPVKVWIYGGAEDAGGISDPLYNGCNLAAKGDSLVISIAYRLGPLGFLALEDAGIGGNFGIQDILLGLEWVQKNIARFGGDPKKVLLFGQSAGAANSFIVSTLPQAPSLIHAVIMESGGGRSYTGNGVANFSASFAGLVNCSTSDIQCLRSASLTTLNTAVPSLRDTLTIERGNSYGWGPRLDGKIVPADPGVVGSKVPAMFGSNTEEGTLFALAYYGSRFKTLNSTDYTTFLEGNFGAGAATVETYFPISAFNSTPFPVFFAISTVFSYSSYRCPAARGLQLSAKNNLAAYTYLSAQAPSCSWYSDLPQSPEVLTLLGATHTSEIPYVFGQTADLPLPNGNCSFDDQEVKISEALVAAWTAMAASGDPANELVEWPAWNASASLGVYVQNATTPAAVNYTACELFLGIDAALMNLTGSITSGSSNTSGTLTGTATASTSPSTAKSDAIIFASNLFVLIGLLGAEICILV